MTARKPADNHSAVLGLLGLLMTAHLTFLGFTARMNPHGDESFQRAAETYVAILLALMTPLAPK